MSTKAYYASDFSTVLRIVKAAQLSVEIDSADTDGRHPLPKYISDATIAFGKALGGDAMVYTPVKPTTSQVGVEVESETTERAPSSRHVSSLAIDQTHPADQVIGNSAE